MAGRTVSVVEVLDAHARTRAVETHTGVPAKVLKYDPAKNTADLEIVVKDQDFNNEGERTYRELPTLPNVPVIWPRAGGYSVVLPMTAGDFVWVHFSEAALTEWRATGQLSEPWDASRHSIGYPFCVPGAFPDAMPLDPADLLEREAGAVIIGKDGGANPLTTVSKIYIDGTVPGVRIGTDATEHVMSTEACALLIFNTLVALMSAAATAGVTPLTPTGLQPLIGAAITTAITGQMVPAPPTAAAQDLVATADSAAYASGTAPMTTSASLCAPMLLPGAFVKTPNESGVCPSVGSAFAKVA